MGQQTLYIRMILCLDFDIKNSVIDTGADNRQLLTGHRSKRAS